MVSFLTQKKTFTDEFKRLFIESTKKKTSFRRHFSFVENQRNIIPTNRISSQLVALIESLRLWTAPRSSHNDDESRTTTEFRSVKLKIDRLSERQRMLKQIVSADLRWNFDLNSRRPRMKEKLLFSFKH